MDDHGKLARGHLGQIPKTLVVAMSLLDGGSQRIRGTDVGSLEGGRCGDKDPVVGVAVGVDLTVHHSGKWPGALGPAGHSAGYTKKLARWHGSGWQGKEVGR